jgi:hypothetical protein
MSLGSFRAGITRGSSLILTERRVWRGPLMTETDGRCLLQGGPEVRAAPFYFGK